MKIAYERPPNFKQIVKVLPQAARHGIIFCYGDTIFNPSRVPIPMSLHAHESVHARQQGKSPEDWWDRYLLDRQFRFEQELAAHKAEYAEILKMAVSRNERRSAALSVGTRLADPLYGRFGLRPKQAANMLKDGVLDDAA